MNIFNVYVSFEALRYRLPEPFGDNAGETEYVLESAQIVLLIAIGPQR